MYRAARGETPIITGSIPVTDWALIDATRGLWRGRPAGVTPPWPLRHLYVDGRRATRARSEFDPATWQRTPRGYRFIAPSQPIPTWRRAGDLEAVTVPQWKMMRCPVERAEGPELVMAQPCWDNANSFVAREGQSLWDFRELAWLENAFEFLDQPGEWYYDRGENFVYYLARAGEDLRSVPVELPVQDALITAFGSQADPIRNLRFEGLTFAYATWLGPSTPYGYAADQSGFHVVTDEPQKTYIGHFPAPARTPGAVRLEYAQNVEFKSNTFTHLGGVALDFGTGSQENRIAGNTFADISSAAIQLGGIAERDHHPRHSNDLSRDNLIDDNAIEGAGREYYDAAGIYVGFTTRTTISHNDIADVPWSGIAVGWGWGLLDEGAFPGLPGAEQGDWGQWSTPSASRENRILSNRISRFLQQVWDGGAIYTQGAQGTSLADGELIAWNVAYDKRPAGGGNVFYTDGGSRYVTLFQNASYRNPVGETDFGPCGLPAAIAACQYTLGSPADDRCSSVYACWLVLPYGNETGGCVPHGDLAFFANYRRSGIFSTVCETDRTEWTTFRYAFITLIGGATSDGIPSWLL